MSDQGEMLEVLDEMSRGHAHLATAHAIGGLVVMATVAAILVSMVLR